MFIKDGNYNEFGIKTNFQEFKKFLNESINENLVIDIHGVVQTLVNLNCFGWDIVKHKDNRRELWLDDVSQETCPIFVNMKDIKHIIRGTGFYSMLSDQYILILKHNIMYHLYVE